MEQTTSEQTEQTTKPLGHCPIRQMKLVQSCSAFMPRAMFGENQTFQKKHLIPTVKWWKGDTPRKPRHLAEDHEHFSRPEHSTDPCEAICLTAEACLKLGHVTLR